jgi:ABC-2 type transport system permease protein
MSPVPLHHFWGYVIGGVCRGVLVGLIVTVMSLFFTDFIFTNYLLPFIPSYHLTIIFAGWFHQCGLCEII